MAAMHLGDLGAHVVRVDATDDERGRDEPGFLAWHRNNARRARPDDPDGWLPAAFDRRSDVVIFDSSLMSSNAGGLTGAR
jgi:hypothetical protein